MQALERLTDRGLSVAADGDRLIVAPANRLDDELRAFIRESKPEIMRTLQAAHGIPRTELRELAGLDWPELESDPELLETFALSVSTRRMREQGEVPPDWTATTECVGCGLVPTWEGCPDTMLTCLWCFNRVSGRPVPPVTEIRS